MKPIIRSFAYTELDKKAAGLFQDSVQVIYDVSPNLDILPGLGLEKFQ
jgi:hypothetical protein